MTLTPEERAAIEAYSGEVTRVETGVSGLGQMRWCPRRNGLFNVEDGKFLSKAESLRRGRRMFKGGSSPEMQERRAFVKANHTKMTMTAMANKWGCDRTTIRNDLYILGLRRS